MTTKQFFTSPFRVLYIGLWLLLIVMFLSGILVPIFFGKGFAAITVFVLVAPALTMMMGVAWLSRKARYTQNLKIFGKGLINAHKRLWKYFITLDDDALVEDMINGD